MRFFWFGVPGVGSLPLAPQSQWQWKYSRRWGRTWPSRVWTETDLSLEATGGRGCRRALYLLRSREGKNGSGALEAVVGILPYLRCKFLPELKDPGKQVSEEVCYCVGVFREGVRVQWGLNDNTERIEPDSLKKNKKNSRPFSPPIIVPFRLSFARRWGQTHSIDVINACIQIYSRQCDSVHTHTKKKAYDPKCNGMRFWIHLRNSRQDNPNRL